MFCLVVYISNRYSSEKEIQKIDALQKELTDMKYKALSSASKLTERCRQSKVLQMLKENNDSLLHISDKPAFVVVVKEEE